MLLLTGLLGIAVLGAAFIGEVDSDEDDEVGHGNGADPAQGSGPSNLSDTSAGGTQDPWGGQGSATTGDGVPRLVGTDAADEIATGDEGSDVGAYGGDDVVEGGAGIDTIRGGDGNDMVSGGGAEDTLFGDGGDDNLHGGTGDDAVFGNNGDDAIFGGDGDDDLVGGDGADTVAGGDGDDAIQGMAGDDSLIGGLGTDTLFGGLGDDRIDGTLLDAGGADADGMDFLNGGDGDDTITAGTGDYVHLGDGQDTLLVGSWIDGDSATVQDFDPEEDQLVVIHDAGGVPPDLALSTEAGNTVVRLGGVPILTVQGETNITIDQITLLPQSAATGGA